MKAEDILSEVLRRYEEALKKHGKSAKTLAEAQALSGRLGKDLGRILAEELLKAFPSGPVSEEVAMAVIPAALRKNSSVVSGFVREIQKKLNEAARVPAPAEGRFRQERAANLARWVAKQEEFADHETIFSQYVEQNSRMTVDDAVRDQVKAHYGMGLSPKIIRKAAPGCCDWCTKHAGTVDYGPGMDKEIFRRHKNCPCLIEYDPDKGARNIERVNNYRFDKDMDPEEVERRKQVGQSKFRGKDVTAEYFGTATPGKGEFKQDEGVLAEDVRIAHLLQDTFGGDIHVQKDVNKNHVKTPDYIWRGKQWELKTTHSDTAVKSALKEGIKQIKEFPGGIVVDMAGENRNMETTLANIESRFRQGRVAEMDVIILRNDRVIKVVRYHK